MMTAHRAREEKILATAGGVTGLWAVAWLGATVMSAGAPVQGGFAVGSVMAGSGLATLWWKTRALAAYLDEEAPENAQDPSLGGASRRT